jgi:DnaJ-class molecular chaperone
MNHYSTLGVTLNSTDLEIKAAYRKLAIKYHPDKNNGNKEFEEKFKKIAEAYSILGDPEKRKKYDSLFIKKEEPIKNPHFGKNRDFKTYNDFEREQSNKRARDSQFKTHQMPPDTQYLNINIDTSIVFSEALDGKKLILKYKRNKIKYEAVLNNKIKYESVKEEKEVAIDINLQTTYFPIKKEGSKFFIKARISKLGNEDVHEFRNIFNEFEQSPLFGDVLISIELIISENITIDTDRNIIQRVRVPLYKILSNEKTRIETVYGKKYDININDPDILNDLKSILPINGLIKENNKSAEYIIMFDILTPDIKSLNKSDRELLISMLSRI